MSKIRPCEGDASDGAGSGVCGEMWTTGELMPGGLGWARVSEEWVYATEGIQGIEDEQEEKLRNKGSGRSKLNYADSFWNIIFGRKSRNQ
jgi:hypothetical protein